MVERNLAKVEVAGSSPVSRSTGPPNAFGGLYFLYFNLFYYKIWRGSQAVQGEGLQNLYSSVRIRPAPLKKVQIKLALFDSKGQYLMPSGPRRRSAIPILIGTNPTGAS